MRFSNLAAFGLVVLAVLVGLIALLLGLIWEINASAFASNLLPQVSSTSVDSDEEYRYRLYRAELDDALANDDLSHAVTILEEIYQLEQHSSFIEKQLAHTHTQLGLSLRTRGFVEDALDHFERAVEILPKYELPQQEAHLASLYLSGIEKYQAGNWEAAIADLKPIWAESKTYGNIKDLLYSAYYNHALALQAADRARKAKTSLKAAISLHPELSEPRRLLAEIEFELSPQTDLAVPLEDMMTAKDQLIVVGIAEQQMLVYEKGELVFDFVVSTGEPGRDTAVGEFEILNKIDNAYASTWNLDMPYWMGIYWSGPLQNGIHALPIEKHTGYKLWDGYLGQRVSYGCIILDDGDAATLYDWTKAGTKVKIVPSLAYWSPEEAF